MGIIWMYILLCLLEQLEAGKKKSCQTMPPITNGEVVHINHDVRKVICVKGFKLAVKSSRFMRCNYSTGSWSYNGNPECIDKNECATKKRGPPCNRHATCINTIGSYKCVCQDGYQGNGLRCSPITAKFVNTKGCGVVRETKNKTLRRVRRIVGGTISQPGDWPWVALININEGIFGGVLISPYWILTTANALYQPDGHLETDKVMVTLGEYDRNKPENEEQHIGVEKIFIHHEFNNLKNLDNDVALLKLKKPAHMSDHVNTICLDSYRKLRKYERNYKTATVSGWGITTEMTLPQILRASTKELIHSGVLQDVDIPLIPPYMCGKATSYFYRKKTMLCAGDTTNKLVNSPCIGDIGSPLTIQDPVTKRWVLLGLFSWSEGCGQSKKYSYYTRVSWFTKWINEVTGIWSNDLI